jgi:SH3 domain protein
MKTILWIMVLFILLPADTYAETMYVKDVQITLRMGPKNRRKIIQLLDSGTKVEVLKPDVSGWTYVRAPNGNEGWVLSQYLVEERPKRFAAEVLEKELSDLNERINTLEAEKQTLIEQNQTLETQLAEKEARLNETLDSYQELKQDSDLDSIRKMQTEYRSAKAQLENQEKLAQKLIGENKRLKYYQSLYWFLAGAGVFLLGTLAGASARSRKRNTGLYT